MKVSNISQNRRDRARALIGDLDRCRNLSAPVPIAAFVLAGAAAFGGFFRLVDVMTWIGLARLDPVLPSSVAFVLLFLVWALLFLIFMSAFERFGIVAIGPRLQAGLTRLSLTPDDLAALRADTDSQSWRHDRIVRLVLDELAARPHGPQPPAKPVDLIADTCTLTAPALTPSAEAAPPRVPSSSGNRSPRAQAS